MSLSVIILAAGKGTRMHSARPKVLQSLAGKPLLSYVLDSTQKLGVDSPIVVYGFGADKLKEAYGDHSIVWAKQSEQLGTGHAVQMALPYLPKTGKSVILYGDVPLIGSDTLQRLIDTNTSGIAILTMDIDNPTGLGRIVRHDGKVKCIVEEKDASLDQKTITEINSGIYCVDNALLHNYLPKLRNNNAQGEYYLTDLIAFAVEDGLPIATISPTHSFEIEGVNDRTQLARLERSYQAHLITTLQKQGVQFTDPARADIRGDVQCGRDVLIDVNCILHDVVIGDNVTIEAGAIIKNTTIGTGTHILPYCVIDGSTIGAQVTIGPFAHLRTQTILQDGSKIGNFVETKKSTIGTGSKVNHLSYIGDSTVGAGVNIGAGVITCNYDGVNKFATTIGDGAFVGSNASLVAPVVIGKGATIGAGSVITDDVPKDTLALGRARQSAINNWKRPKK